MIVGVDGTVFVDKLTGIGRYCYELLIEWAKLSPEKTFYIYTPFALSVTFDNKNIIVKKDSFFSKGNRFNRVKKLVWMHFLLPIYLKKDDVDIFWSGNGIVPFFKTTKLIITIHDFVYKLFPETMHPMSYYNRKFFQAIAINKSDIIFSNSQSTANELKTYYNREVDDVIRPSISNIFKQKEQNEIKNVINKYHLPDKYNLIVATFEPRKNLELFISIYIDILSKNIDLSPLVLVGKSGWKDSSINELIKKGIKLNYILETGYIDYDDLPSLYSGADTFFMPSLYEGFGIPILEARRCGTSVICSNVPAMQEAGGENCIYHIPTKEGIENALNSLANKEINFINDYANDFKETWKTGALKINTLANSLK